MAKVLVLLIALSACLSAQTQTVPQFRDYATRDIYTGKNAPLILAHDDLPFRSKLEASAAQKPNFAGHYILAVWGCGDECVFGAAIDAKTGKVIRFPFSVCCWGSGTDDEISPIEFRPDSSLIVFTGQRNKQGQKAAHYYTIEADKFVYIKSVAGTHR